MVVQMGRAAPVLVILLTSGQYMSTMLSWSGYVDAVGWSTFRNAVVNDSHSEFARADKEDASVSLADVIGAATKRSQAHCYILVTCTSSVQRHSEET